MKRLHLMCGWIGGRGVWFGTLLFLGGLIPSWGGEARGLGFTSLSNAVVPIYLEGQPKPEAVLRVQSVRRVHKRQGFYRIGLIPALLVEDVTVEILRPDAVRDALKASKGSLRALGKGLAVELRRIEVTLAGDAAAKLRAESLLLDSGSAWRLRGRVRLETNQSSFESESAELTIVGRNAGRLEFKTDQGKQTFTLFDPDCSKSQPPTLPSQ